MHFICSKEEEEFFIKRYLINLMLNLIARVEKQHRLPVTKKKLVFSPR